MKHSIYHGSCLCNGIQFQIHSGFDDIIQCHCQKCRKATGTAFATNAPIAKSAFTLLKGHDLLKSYRSSELAERFFCGNCGSPIYSVKQSVPDIYRIRIGLIEEDIYTPISKHVFVGSKANWDKILDNHPQFMTYPE